MNPVLSAGIGAPTVSWGGVPSATGADASAGARAGTTTGAGDREGDTAGAKAGPETEATAGVGVGVGVGTCNRRGTCLGRNGSQSEDIRLSVEAVKVVEGDQETWAEVGTQLAAVEEVVVTAVGIMTNMAEAVN